MNQLDRAERIIGDFCAREWDTIWERVERDLEPPLVSIGQGDYTTEIHGRDGRLLSPPRGVARRKAGGVSFLKDEP